jgi:hypothetical protein
MMSGQIALAERDALKTFQGFQHGIEAAKDIGGGQQTGDNIYAFS